jgi:uncharacterized protein YecE (DUF72 family)
MTLAAGTSGWQYRDWRGRFYPERLPQSRWLEHYAARFATVEVNNAFYRLPAATTFESWRQRTPADFVITVKASRYLTHVRRLRDPAEPVALLLSRMEPLGDRLGPVLLQLPPTMRAEPARLDDTLACFPTGVRVAVEMRHRSWFVPEVRALLERHGATLCLADRDSRPVTPLWRTADWAYLRLHAGRSAGRPGYGDTALRSWALRLAELWGRDVDGFVYFNNDQRACAVRDAARFAVLARRLGLEVTRVPPAAELSGACLQPA